MLAGIIQIARSMHLIDGVCYHNCGKYLSFDGRRLASRCIIIVLAGLCTTAMDHLSIAVLRWLCVLDRPLCLRHGCPGLMCFQPQGRLREGARSVLDCLSLASAALGSCTVSLRRAGARVQGSRLGARYHVFSLSRASASLALGWGQRRGKDANMSRDKYSLQGWIAEAVCDE